METICSGEMCLFSQISWLWYTISVVIAFGLGFVWYSLLFTKKWVEAVKFQCPCGADLAKGEKCNCKPSAAIWLTFVFQIIATAFIGLMYFVLTSISIWLSIIVVIAICAWMKSTLKFQIMDTKRWMTLCLIDVGYFFAASVIYILFALI